MIGVMSLAHPRAGDSRVMLAVSVPQGGAELLSNIRHIDEYDRRKPSSSQRLTGDLCCSRQNNFIGAGINANWRQSYR